MAVPGVKQVSNGYRLQGGSSQTIQRTASPQPPTYNPQQTVSGSYLQPAASGAINQGAYSGSSLYVNDGGGGGGGGGAYVAPEPPPDPYARWGGYAGYQKAVSDFTNTKNVTYGSIEDSIDDTVLGTKSSILDFLTNYQQQQKGIDKQSMKNELTREKGRLGVLDMVGQGLRNGQITLNNNNASSSSAAEQIARAYGRMGQKQMMGINTDYNLGQEDVKDAQEALGISAETFKRKYGEDKQTATNKIVQTAISALANLDNMAATSGVGDRINLDAERTRIRNQALAELGVLDSVFSEGVAKVKPVTREQNRGEAFKLLHGGYVPENKLGFESTLPIYTLGA